MDPVHGWLNFLDFLPATPEFPTSVQRIFLVFLVREWSSVVSEVFSFDDDDFKRCGWRGNKTDKNDCECMMNMILF